MNAVRPYLLVGKLLETLDMSVLRRNEVGAMLQLAEEVPQPGIVSLYLPILDGEPLPAETLTQGVAFVREQHEAGRNTLIACGLGVSRAATFAVAALREIEGMSLRDAFAEVSAARREARPHPVLWQSLCAYCDESVEYVEMLRLSRPPRIPW
jgi:histidinol-phosphate aminotransferase